MLEQAATKATDALLDKGVLGAVCVLLIIALGFAGLVIRALYKDLQACNGVALTDRTKLIEAMVAVRETGERTHEALTSIRATLETRGQGMADVSPQVELVAEKVQHGFGNVSQALESFVRLMDAARGRERSDRERS